MWGGRRITKKNFGWVEGPTKQNPKGKKKQQKQKKVGMRLSFAFYPPGALTSLSWARRI